jgi:phosphoglycolate phosphatase
MKTKVDLIMFDFDGTLVDSKYDIAASANHVLSARGLPQKDPELIASYIGDGIHVLLGRTLETSDGADVKDAVETFREHYWKHCLDRTVDYEGVKETLEHFAGTTKAIVTNKPLRFTNRILEGLGLDRYFVSVLGGDGPHAKKPSPEGFLAVLDSLGVPAEAAMVVGDSHNDIIAGRSAGCITCAVTYGLGKRAVLETTHPHMIIDRFAELQNLVE